MSRITTTISVLAVGALGLPALGGGWVDFNNETTLRMPLSHNTASLSTTDPEEKDYAWGDVDLDGDIDLVCVRKQPFTSTGKRVNVLFMNEGVAEGHAINGVFADRTDEYASASDVGGDNGFNTATNDRDVVLVDVDGDGWLDMVTATTLTDNQAKHMSHPRVYMNLGEDAGVWQGFRFENDRIPQMHATAGPRFCSVAAGDLTGNGAPDLYFGDYDSGGSQIFDYNNRLLINDGNGFFTDETSSRLTSEMALSAFGAASVIADMNGNGVNDVVKQTSLNSPTHIAVTYNNPTSEGFFNLYDTIYGNAPYFVTEGDLNSDGKLDLVVVDDGTDRYMLNQGNDGAGRADWTTFTLPSGPSGGFGGNALIRDLNKDGHADVITTDVDVDISGCSRQMHVYRNLGNVPNVSFQEQGQVIPNNMLTGTHDVAIFDINGDTWLDMVIGRCSGTQIWINVPPTGLVFSYPGGLPGFLTPNQATTFTVEVDPIGASHEEDTGKLFYSVDGGAYTETSMTYLGGDQYEGTIPGVDCTQTVRFYVTAEVVGGQEFTDPAGAPAAFYSAIAADGTDITLREEMEDDVSGWTTSAEAGTTSGFWEAVDPHFTLDGATLVAPADDATAGEGTVAFVTDDAGVDDAPIGSNDVDGGPVYLESPVFDLDGTDATISYARWVYSTDSDALVTQISNNGGASYSTVNSLTTNGTGSAWQDVAFIASDWIVPTSNMRVRFYIADAPNNTVTEAGIDNFQIEEFVCGSPCVGDIDGSGDIGFGDLLGVLSAWGSCPGCPQDLDGDDIVGFSDVLTVLSAWGPCP